MLAGSTSRRDTWLTGVFPLRLYVPINDLARTILKSVIPFPLGTILCKLHALYNKDIRQIKKKSKVKTLTRWLAVQFVSSRFLIEAVIFDNIWAWDKYFGALSFYSMCNCWYFITFLKTYTNHCHSTIIKYLTATMWLTYWKLMSPLFISLFFFHDSHFFRSLRTVPRQYVPLSKSFWTNFGEFKKLSKYSIKCVFSDF